MIKRPQTFGVCAIYACQVCFFLDLYSSVHYSWQSHLAIKSYTGYYLSADAFYLSADGSGITEATGGGAGSVTCSKDCRNESQHFFIIPVAEDTNIYTIQSVAHPGVYLRMDGSGITQFSYSGKGTVNLQYGASSDLEKFKIVYNAGNFAGMFSFESKAFPFVYLRTNGGKSVVNCQYGARSHEMYTITAVQ